MQSKRRLALFVASASCLPLLPSFGQAQVEIQNFQNFSPDDYYGSWDTANATITSGPTNWETSSQSGGYGSCYYGLYTDTGSAVNADGYSMLQLTMTVNSGDAACIVDLDDGEGDFLKWVMGGYGLTAGTYVLDVPFSLPSQVAATASRNEPLSGFDQSQITGMNFELDPGATNGVANPYDVSWTDLSAVNPNLTWDNANAAALNVKFGFGNTGASAPFDGATWDSANNVNWNNGTNSSMYADQAKVTFNDANNGNYVVTLNATVHPAAVTVNNSIGNYSISGTGTIAGSTSLSKSGTGMLALNTSNTYSGGTTVTNGTLALGNAKALGFGGVITGSPGSTSVSGNGTIDLAGQTITQPITLNGGSLINSNTSTAAGVTSGILGNGIISSTTSFSGDAKLTYTGSGTGAAAAPVLGISNATFTLSNGGSDYNAGGRGVSAANPTVTVTGGGGTGAVLEAITSTAGVVTGINIISPGVGFTSAPTITISAPLAGGTQATVTSFDLFALEGIQETAAGSGYFTSPTASISATSGSAVLGTPVISGVNLAGTGNIGGAGNITLAGAVTGIGMFNKIGTGTVVLTAPNSYSGGTTVNAGTLIVGASGSLPSGAVNVTGGMLQLAPSTGLATVTSLAVSGNGEFDVANNHVIINYGAPANDPIASIAGLLSSGFNEGAWNGPGIISSTAAVTPGYGLGYADSADPGNPAGLASGTIEIKYTLLGDTNLDGIVNGTDFGTLAANFNKGLTPWDAGDFNYAGIVNGTDFGQLAANFNKGATGASIGEPAYDDPAILAFASANGLLADVPEPASIALLSMSLITLFPRRRRLR